MRCKTQPVDGISTTFDIDSHIIRSHVCGDPLHLPEVGKRTSVCCVDDERAHGIEAASCVDAALLACVRDHPRPVAARELLEVGPFAHSTVCPVDNCDDD